MSSHIGKHENNKQMNIKQKLSTSVRLAVSSARRAVFSARRVATTLFVTMIAIQSVVAHPLTGLLERIDKGASRKIVFEIKHSESASTSCADYFELDQKGTRPVVRANNYVNAAVGLNWYLKYYCGVQLTWNCMTARLPQVLPRVEKKERHETNLTLRYDFNYCTFSYSMAFWDWEHWQTEIDWMALHGINMPLCAVGHECVWRNTLLRLGYSEEEIGRFIAGPAFLAWWEMNNLEGWGGPLPASWYAQQETLQKRILKRMHEYGMKPVLPGYSGMCPSFTSQSKKTGAERGVSETTSLSSEESAQSSLQLWNGFTRPGVIFPGDPKFDEYARLFYEETEKLYGKAEYYSIDPFHEAKHLPSDLNIGKAGKEIMKAMKTYGNKDAKWVLQGWSENPRDEMLDALPIEDVIVLDLFSECRPQYGDPNSVWYREKGYRGHAWMFCLLENFGANIGMHGRMDQLLDNYTTALRQYSGKLKGIGLTMEGSETNPVMYELMCELPWRNTTPKKEEWIKEYIKARYGLKGDSPLNIAIAECWNHLIHGIYNCPMGNNQQGPSESIFCSRPSLNSYQASSWSKMVPYYNAESTIKAAESMASVAEQMSKARLSGELSETAWNNFEYDLTDVCRQAIADHARSTYHLCIADFKNFDSKGFKQHSTRFLDLLLMQDQLLAARSEFRVGRWIEQARSLGTTPTEQDQYEWNARVQITTWGDRYCADTGKLRDYAHKEWNGILKDFYYKRWKHFFGILQDELDGKLPMCPIGNSSTKTDGNPAAGIDWYAMEEPWTKDHSTYSAEPEGDIVQLANKVLRVLNN